MSTLHRIKLLATHCAIAPTTSATHSPTASPIVRHRRQTLRMLFDSRHQEPPETTNSPVRVRRHKLKDLLLFSPPSPSPPPTQPLGDGKRRRHGERQEQEGLLPAVHASGGIVFRFRTGSGFRRGTAAALGPVSSALWHRLLRRGWRPVLLTIPE